MTAQIDQLNKRSLVQFLEPVHIVETDRKVPVQVQSTGVWGCPKPGYAEHSERLGWLGRMANTLCLLEPFSRTPGLDEVRECRLKQLVLHEDLVLQWQRDKKKGPEPAFPQLWILSPGVPKSVLTGYAMRPMPDWPDGFWQCPASAMELYLVVLEQLPRERATLTLRLFGCGQTRRDAVADLIQLPDDSWECQATIPSLIAFHVQASQNPVGEIDMQTLQEVNAIYEHWKQKVRQDGTEEGRKSGLQDGIRALCTGFGIEMTEERERQLAVAELERLEILMSEVLHQRQWPAL